MQERSVILYTFSKKYAMTGWRLGASTGPKDIIDMMAKLNVNDESCSNHFIQYGGIEALTGDQSGHLEILSILKERRDMTVDFLNDTAGVRCYRPDATFYLFPNVTELMQAKGLTDYEALRKAALQDTGVSFCTRRHFGSPIAGEKEFYIRFAYSGIDLDQIGISSKPGRRSNRIRNDPEPFGTGSSCMEVLTRCFKRSFAPAGPSLCAVHARQGH